MVSFAQWPAGKSLTADRINAMVGPMTTYVPAITNGGSATFSKTGLYAVVGPLVWVSIDVTVGTAGSGSGIVTISMPTTVDRTGRQVLVVHAESIGAGGNASSHIAGGECVFFPGSVTALSDRIRTDEGGTTARENNILGNDLLAGGHLTITGFYLAG